MKTSSSLERNVTFWLICYFGMFHISFYVNKMNSNDWPNTYLFFHLKKSCYEYDFLRNILEKMKMNYECWFKTGSEEELQEYRNEIPFTGSRFATKMLDMEVGLGRFINIFFCKNHLHFSSDVLIAFKLFCNVLLKQRVSSNRWRFDYYPVHKPISTCTKSWR